MILLMLISGALARGSVQEMYRAKNWSALRAEVSVLAKNEESLERRLANLALLQATQGFCDQQLDEGNIPVSCFQLIDMELKSGLISSESHQRSKKTLEGVCRGSSVVPTEAFNHKWIAALPASCSQRLQYLSRVWIYSHEDQARQKDFGSRLAPVLNSVRTSDGRPSGARRLEGARKTRRRPYS